MARDGKIEKEILLLGGLALAVIVGLELYKGEDVTKNAQVGLRDICPSGQTKVPLAKCMAMTPQCMNAPSFKCVDVNERQVKYSNAEGRRTRRTRRAPIKSDFRSASEVRRLQKMFPYNEGDNAKKPWWKCGCGNEGVGGCVRGVCIGPGSISIRF